MPVNIQEWEEEKVPAIMNVLNLVLGQERGFGPGPGMHTCKPLDRIVLRYSPHLRTS